MPAWLTWKALTGFGQVALGVIGGVRAAIFLAFALWFAWQAHKWEALATGPQEQADTARERAYKAAAELAKAQAKVTERVVTKYVDRVKVVAGRTRTIIKEVPIYVPATTPDLPAGFRVLHDSAAQGVIPDPARIADAAPVPAQDAAETVVENYGTCHETAEQVIALQDWIRAQQAVK